MFAKDNEIVWEADIPEKTVADFIRTQSAAKKEEPATNYPQATGTKKTDQVDSNQGESNRCESQLACPSWRFHCCW